MTNKISGGRHDIIDSDDDSILYVLFSVVYKSVATKLWLCWAALTSRERRNFTSTRGIRINFYPPSPMKGMERKHLFLPDERIVQNPISEYLNFFRTRQPFFFSRSYVVAWHFSTLLVGFQVNPWTPSLSFPPPKKKANERRPSYERAEHTVPEARTPELLTMVQFHMMRHISPVWVSDW